MSRSPSGKNSICWMSYGSMKWASCCQEVLFVAAPNIGGSVFEIVGGSRAMESLSLSEETGMLSTAAPDTDR